MDYKIGSIIQYRPHGGGTRTVRVTGKEIHNGQPSFDGVTDNGIEVWGYDHQITGIVWK